MAQQLSNLFGSTPAKGGLGLQNLLHNGGFEFWYAGTSSAPDGWALTGAGASVERESTEVKLGTYSAKITRSGANVTLNQDFHAEKGIDYWKDRTVTYSAWIKTSVANRYRIRVADDVGGTWSSYHTGGGGWELLTATYTIDSSATSATAIIDLSTTDGVAYFDGAMLVEGSVPFAFSPHPEDHLYEPVIEHITVFHQTGLRGKIVNYTYASNDGSNTQIDFMFPVPRQVAGKTFVIDSITIYGNTQDNGSYIDRVDLASYDQDGSVTIEIGHTTDIGNGTSGDFNHDIVDSAYEMTGSGHYLTLTSDANTQDNVRIYDIEVKGHVKVHE